MTDAFLLGAAVLALFLAACGDDCGSISRFTDKNGLTVLVICGQIQIETPLPTRTPTPTPM